MGRGLAVMFALMILGAGTSSASAAAEVKLVGPLTAARKPSGGVSLSGSVKFLPEGTKVELSVLRDGAGRSIRRTNTPDAEVIITRGGGFTTGPLTAGKDWPAGPTRVEVLSYFNPGWQTVSVARALGIEVDAEGRWGLTPEPTRLPQSTDLVPGDSEFPTKSGRYLKTTRVVSFPPIGREQLAIRAVKAARLFVKGEGRSAEPIERIVEFNQQVYAKSNPTAFQVVSWSAKSAGAAGWVVTLDCYNEGRRDQAQWSYSGSTGVVKYLDPLAKTLSWMPKE